MDYHIISFPGLGIDGIRINRLVFSVGNIQVAWYGLLITIGIALAVLYCIRRAKSVGIDSDTVIDIALLTVVLGVLGARLYYVIADWKNGGYDSLYDVIAIWNGGLAIYGGVIGGILGIFIMCRVKKINFLTMMDIAAPSVMIGQIIGRWGNFTNAEAFGSLQVYDFFGKTFDTSHLFENLFCRMGIQYGELPFVEYVHPTFLYESLWNLIGFLWINAIWKKRRRDGQIAWCYLSWYGFGRMWIEGFRTDSLYAGSLRVSQLLGAVCFLGALSLLIFTLVRPKPLWKREIPAQDPAPADMPPAAASAEESIPAQEQTALPEEIQNSADQTQEESSHDTVD